jgi:hypothetical protein
MLFFLLTQRIWIQYTIFGAAIEFVPRITKYVEQSAVADMEGKKLLRNLLQFWYADMEEKNYSAIYYSFDMYEYLDYRVRINAAYMRFYVG